MAIRHKCRGTCGLDIAALYDTWMKTTRICEFEEMRYKFLVIRAERGRSCREVFIHRGSFLDTAKYLEETFSVKLNYNDLWEPRWNTVFYVAPPNFCAHHLARASMIHTLIFAIPEKSKFVTILLGTYEPVATIFANIFIFF